MHRSYSNPILWLFLLRKYTLSYPLGGKGYSAWWQGLATTVGMGGHHGDKPLLCFRYFLTAISARDLLCVTMYTPMKTRAIARPLGQSNTPTPMATAAMEATIGCM